MPAAGSIRDGERARECPIQDVPSRDDAGSDSRRTRREDTKQHQSQKPEAPHTNDGEQEGGREQEEEGGGRGGRSEVHSPNGNGSGKATWGAARAGRIEGGVVLRRSEALSRRFALDYTMTGARQRKL